MRPGQATGSADTSPAPPSTRYHLRLAADARDIDRARALRARLFRPSDPGGPALEGDAFDALCRHVLIEDRAHQDRLIGCFRLAVMTPAQVAQGYSAQFYDLAPLAARGRGPMLEMGRFCCAPGRLDVDVLRLAWGALARIVTREGVGLLFGCLSFSGTAPDRHAGALGWIGQHHGAAPPIRALPGQESVALRGFVPARDRRAAETLMPPLLRSYLGLGGWVSDDAVIDPALGTLHVLTGVEIATIPAARQQALRRVAGLSGAFAPEI